ncbi:Uncharacterised protein [uncultured archaeon]|nr:Uncharacterised protein [uncultured archaeon]
MTDTPLPRIVFIADGFLSAHRLPLSLTILHSTPFDLSLATTTSVALLDAIVTMFIPMAAFVDTR